MENPNDRLYSKEHEWAKIDGNKVVIGISDHAQDALGDIVYVEMPKIGAELSQMKEFGVVESVKTVSTLYSPLSGKVIELNDGLSSSPQSINEDPYGKGWIITIELSNPSEKGSLLSSDAYEAFLKESK
ncbi:glycine cleavage system protein GcvH [Candidatus Saganbacteria bacterium]|nr:glycine cleavage system protein GcvH [Candidatus Saganbacteria bacterium]